MTELRIMLRIATALPYDWWMRIWWKVYFERRVFVLVAERD